MNNESVSHMTSLDWAMAVFWVLGTSLFGLWFVRYVKTAKDYLVAGRKLKWWQIGIAQAADSVDAGDFIAIAGLGWLMGFTGLGYIWIGMAFGTYILARYLAPLLYRTGVVTNAEFLELRFNPAMRIASALIQIFYRFIALALVGYALATMFKVVVGIDMTWGIVISMCITIVYVFASGQLGVVMAAVPQVILMLVLTVIIFFSVFADIGWLSGFNENKETYGEMLSLTFYSKDGIDNNIFLIGLILVLFTYPIVNQTVAQRIVSANSEADARKGSIVSIVPWFMVTGVAILAGIVGHVLMPELTEETRSELYPLYMVEYLPQGVLGLGMAALIVGSMSTGAGIGTAISGLVTNDLVKVINSDRYTDRQKLWWTRIVATVAIVLGAILSSLVDDFDGMVPFYVTFSGTFVLPLTVPYLAAAFCPWASRWSAVASVAGGCVLGLVLFNTGPNPESNTEGLLPIWMTQSQVRPMWVLGFAVLVLIIWSLFENRIYGRAAEHTLARRLSTFDLRHNNMTPDEVHAMMSADEVGDWPAKENVDFETLGIRKDQPWYRKPGPYEIAVVIAMIALMIWLW